VTAVDEYWASVFGSTPGKVWRPGVVVTAHTAALSGYEGLFLFRRGGACRASVPPPLVDMLSQRLEGLNLDTAFDRGTLEEVLGDRVERIIGPNWYGYVDQVRFRSRAEAACRRMAETDRSALARLRAACGEEDWAEGAFDREPPVLFGCFASDGELVAASNLTGWRTGTDQVGVVTRPERRGRGYGAAVASAATTAALEDTAVVAWRARGTNLASIRIALRLGFEHYGENLAVRLR
jgi:RimJ/RimL family protein N-acetyltransferase